MLVSLFLWKLLGVFLISVCIAGAIVFLVREVLSCTKRYIVAFWLFILSEVAAFASLFWTVMWSDFNCVGTLSDYLELPFLGCFILLGSSITVTAYHYAAGTREGTVLLVLTICLGASFVGLQMWEFHDCECDLLNSVFHAASFCTVGLHFSHVFIGLVGLMTLLFMGARNLSLYHVDLVAWYWHFVDYIWLLVFFFIYVS